MTFYLKPLVVHVEFVCDELYEMEADVVADWMVRLEIFSENRGPGIARLYGVGRVRFRGRSRRLAIEEHIGESIPLAMYLDKHERRLWAMEQLLETMNSKFWQKDIAHLNLNMGNIVVVTDATGNDVLYVLDCLGTPLGILGPVHEDYGYDENRFTFTPDGDICMKANDTTAVDVYAMETLLKEILFPTMDEKLTLFCSE